MDLETYKLISAVLIFFLLIFWIIRLEIKLSKLLVGRGETIDDSIANLKAKIEHLEKDQNENEKHLAVLHTKAKKAISGVETIRFNPWRGVGEGGNQSFATAFVNENGDGVVISTLYSREHTSIFSKPVKAGNSSFEMTVEERDALGKASETSERLN
ncbi:MAG: DUF4446 family protein [bacterium]